MVAKPRRLVKASQRRAKNFMLLHGSYIHPSLERGQSEDRSVQQSQFDLSCASAGGHGNQNHKTQDRGRGARKIDKNRANSLFVIDLHE